MEVYYVKMGFVFSTQLCLTCQTCGNSFKSSVQFGKHMCVTIEEENPEYECVSCDKKLTTKKR